MFGKHLPYLQRCINPGSAPIRMPNNEILESLDDTHYISVADPETSETGANKHEI